MRDDERACRRLLSVLEKRAAALELMSDAFDVRRPFIRIGLDHPGLHEVSLVGATYGLPTRTLGAVGLLGPVRMDYDKAVRTVRAAAFELSRLVESAYDEVQAGSMATAERDYYELLGVERTRPTRRSRRRFAGAPASCTPTSRDADAQERFRAVAEAYEVLSNRDARSSTTSTATPACAPRRLCARRLRLLEPHRHLLGLLRRRSLRPQPRRPGARR